MDRKRKKHRDMRNKENTQKATKKGRLRTEYFNN